jgi:NAD(P)-dependent dehydrogenase (short-subunit alcohol dehydrogenase family)
MTAAPNPVPLPEVRSLTVVVVAHDDADNLDQTVDRVVRALTITVEDFRIVIYDDGSRDATPRLARRWQEKLPYLEVRQNAERKGLGYCLLHVAADAETGFIVYVPGDNSWPHRSLVELFGNLGKAEIVTSYSTNLQAVMPPFRRLASQTYTVVWNLLFGQRLHYYNGLTIYPTRRLRDMAMGTHGFGFQAEALVKAIADGSSFVEIALPIDSTTAPTTRMLTPRNIGNALATTARVFGELRLRPGPRSPARGAARAIVSDAERSDATPSPAPLRIVITGASSGIGAALTTALAGDGHQVFVCARRADRLGEIRQKFPSVIAVPCDVSDEGQVRRFVEAVTGATDGIDALVNCAGSLGEVGPVAETDSDAWWQTLQVNLFGTYLMIKHCVPLLQRGRQARIINFAGGGAFNPYPNYSAYACSKTAVVRLTECLAVELRDRGIAVNAIAPGIVATELHRATLEAGEERAGRLQYRRTAALYDDGGRAIENLIRCVRVMLSPTMHELTGKTISSNFDPWQTDTFQTHVLDITRSDLYAMRRVNVVNLPDGDLRRNLSRAWIDFAVGG